MRIGWESNWGKPTDESESRKRRNHTFEYLRKDAREHHPILKQIKDRENEAEKLARHFPAKELEKMLQEICEEQGDQAERAKILRAAMAWSEKREHIDKLKQKAQKVLYPSRIDPDDYTEEYEARSSLEWTIKDIMTKYNDWEKDYELREVLEDFLDDIVYQRRQIREDFDDFHLYKNIKKYLDNRSWYSPQITDFLLVNLIDGHLIDLESDFQFGLFRLRLADQIADIAPEDSFLSSFDWASSTLSPGGKRKRRKWRFKNLMIGSGLIYISIGSYREKKIADLLANHLDLPTWIFTVIGYIGSGFLVYPILSLLYEFINKLRTGYNKLAKAAKKFVVIRFEINSGTYHARTLIERLKKLEEQGIVIHSLTYALLELQEEL